MIQILKNFLSHFSIYISILLSVFAAKDLRAESSTPNQESRQLDSNKKKDTVDSKTRLILNHGYTQIIKSLDSFKWLDKALLLKVERDEIDQIVSEVSRVSDQLATRLETYGKKFEFLNLDDDGLPEIERMKNSHLRKNLLWSFAPFVGKSGADFERSLLLSLDDSLKETSVMAKVLRGMEEAEELKNYLEKVDRELKKLNAQITSELNRSYFKHNTLKK